MSKLTRGKWHYFSSNGCIYCDGKLIAEVAGAGGPNYRHARGEANARLIAAAPELYELLEECADELGAIGLPKLSRECYELLARIDGRMGSGKLPFLCGD